ncbi:MAG: BtpA/SgcQ family protein [Bacteroidota bacterium]
MGKIVHSDQLNTSTVSSLSDLFPYRCPLIGMIHVPALPGTPAYGGRLSDILKKVEEETRVFAELGMDGILLENMHDIPYLKREVGPEITAGMTAAAQVARTYFNGPIGIQILAGANQAALAVALAASLDFVRAEGFVFGHLADEGWMESDAGKLLRYRKLIGATHIPILADIKKKHASHALTQDVDLVETANAAHFFAADGVIVTGNSTGQVVREEDLQVLQATRKKLPVWIGSGLSAENLPMLYPLIDGAIVGSWIKKEGFWKNPLEPARIEQLLEVIGALRKKEPNDKN